MLKKIVLILSVFIVPLKAHGIELGEDGLYIQPWINETFLDLREDLEEANASNKRFLIMFEQRGCVYCKRMHKKIYSIPEIASTLQNSFFVVRINIFGDLEVTDFDGETISEKEIIKKWGVIFTPTVMFLPEKVDEGKAASEAAVVTMPGAFEKGTTKLLLEWVLVKGYNGDEHLQKFIARKLGFE